MTKSLVFLFLMCMTSLSLAQGGFGPGGEEDVPGEGEPKKKRRCGTDATKANCDEDLEFEQNTKKVYHVKTGKPFTGSCESCHYSGVIKDSARFKDGKEDGVSYSFYEDGSKQSMRSNVYGVENGDWMYWYPPSDSAPGKLAWHHQYQSGTKHGKWVWYYSDGTEKKIENYNNGLLDGLVVKYWSPGKKKSEINFKGGDYHGQYLTYHRDGQQISIESNFVRGKKDGKEVNYYKSGQESLVANWKNGKKDGEWISYYKNGADREVINYTDDVLNGKVYSYYEEDGKMKRDATYERGYLMNEILFDQFGNYTDENGKKIDEQAMQDRNKIILATAESRMKQDKKGGKPSYDFESLDRDLMCKCIKAEMAKKQETDECKGAKNNYRKAMEKADKKTQKKMRKEIDDCLKQEDDDQENPGGE